MRSLVKELEQEGYSVVRSNGGHLRITHPDLTGPVFTSSTPSDWRTYRNLRATLRRNRRGGQCERPIV